MPRSLLVWCVALAAALPAFAQPPKATPVKPTDPPKPAAKPDPSDEVFAPKGAVPRFKVTVDKEPLAALQKEPRKYVKCTVTVGEETFKDVGIHLKGAAGSTRDWNDKPALTLNFDHFVSGQRWKGLDKLHLNNSVQDGSYLNEILCSEMARGMGLPTARAAHAVVELNGRKVGLYVLKEGYNNSFVKRNFPDAVGGNLYDGGFLQDIDGALKLDDGPGGDKRDDLKALTKACQIGDAKKRYAAVEKLVDVDRFATTAALQCLACDWDGYVRNHNNYRLYFPPNGGKAVFVPHGMDQMWQNPGEGLLPGWNSLAGRAILDDPAGRKKLLAKIKEMFEKCYVLDALNKRIDEWAGRAKEALATDNKDWAKGFEGEVKNEKERIKQRVEFVKKELPKLK